jgi:hypothetical protein
VKDSTFYVVLIFTATIYSISTQTLDRQRLPHRLLNSTHVWGSKLGALGLLCEWRRNFLLTQAWEKQEMEI